jgi:hypothetical protein
VRELTADAGPVTKRTAVHAGLVQITRSKPYRRAANPRQHFRHSVAAARFLAITHPPRKSRLLPHEKTRRSFAVGSSQRNRTTLMFGAAPLLATRLKHLTPASDFHHMARHLRRAASAHAAQVLQATMNFGACASARRVMRIKRLKRRAFSPSSGRRKPRTTFSLPQRA